MIRSGLSIILPETKHNIIIKRAGGGGGGGGGVFIKILLKLILWLFLIEGSDIYQLVLVPWKNIVPSLNYRRSKVSAYV